MGKKTSTSQRVMMLGSWEENADMANSIVKLNI